MFTAEEALSRIENGHPDVVKAAWDAMLSAYEIDTEEDAARIRLLQAIAAACRPPSEK